MTQIRGRTATMLILDDVEGAIQPDYKLLLMERYLREMSRLFSRVADILEMQPVGGRLTVRITPALSVYPPARLQYAVGSTVGLETQVYPLWVPTAGYHAATSEDQACETCIERVRRFLFERNWADPSDPSDWWCPACTRSPPEYLLAHTPDHGVWFERSVQMTNANK